MTPTLILNPSSSTLKQDGVYFLKASRPYVAQTGQQKKSVQIYVGWAKDISSRLKTHRKGGGPTKGGARLTQVWVENGITMEVILMIPGATRTDERLIKRSGHYDRWLKKAEKTSFTEIEEQDPWEAAYRVSVAPG